MRALSWILAAAAIAVVLLATTAVHVLANLGDGVDLDVAALGRGELGGLFTSAAFWRAFPDGLLDRNLLAFGPAAQVLLFAAPVVAAARRWPNLPAVLWATVLLLGAALPYAVGAVALHGNTVPARSGPWLVWMLVGPCYAALAALAFLVVAHVRTLPRQKLRHAAAAVS